MQVLAVYLLVLVPLNGCLFWLMGRIEWAWFAAPIISILGAAAVIRAGGPAGRGVPLRLRLRGDRGQASEPPVSPGPGAGGEASRLRDLAVIATTDTDRRIIM